MKIIGMTKTIGMAFAIAVINLFKREPKAHLPRECLSCGVTFTPAVEGGRFSYILCGVCRSKYLRSPWGS